MSQQQLRDKLFDLASEVKEGCIVELGTFHGAGTILLARGTRAGYGVPVYTVDDYVNKSGWIGEPYCVEDKEIFRTNIREAGAAVTLINKGFHEAANNWLEPIGLLYWDPGAKNRFWQDWLDWSVYIVQGGYFVIKDTGCGDLGTWPCIEDILETGEFVRDSTRDGITVLRKNDRPIRT